jgi:hypothetical protein
METDVDKRGDEFVSGMTCGWGGKNNGGNITANALDSHLNLPNRNKDILRTCAPAGENFQGNQN